MMTNCRGTTSFFEYLILASIVFAATVWLIGGPIGSFELGRQYTLSNGMPASEAQRQWLLVMPPSVSMQGAYIPYNQRFWNQYQEIRGPLGPIDE